jgi:hypothetical protein
MNENAISVGMRVRYPRTGTTGVVEKIEPISGALFAELDSTRLHYRIDELVPAEIRKEKSVRKTEDPKIIIEREREFASGLNFQETLKNIDQSCEGGVNLLSES